MSRKYIDISGFCKDCSYPILFEAGDATDKDYHISCTNRDCKNFNGVDLFDQDEIPFYKSGPSFCSITTN